MSTMLQTFVPRLRARLYESADTRADEDIDTSKRWYPDAFPHPSFCGLHTGGITLYRIATIILQNLRLTTIQWNIILRELTILGAMEFRNMRSKFG